MAFRLVVAMVAMSAVVMVVDWVVQWVVCWVREKVDSMVVVKVELWADW